MTAPAPGISAELKALLRGVQLGRSLDTLPERLALAKANKLGHAEFLELILSDEVTRREPVDWLALMADPLLAQSAIDRLQSSAYELILDGDSYRQRQRPSPLGP